MARVPTTIPYSIDWRPDGRLLGGEDGRTLLVLAAESPGTEAVGARMQARTGPMQTAPAAAAHVGWP